MFEYDNIFACCDGGQRERTDQVIEYIPRYCGHEKSNKTVTINPLDINCESHFSYSFNFNPDEPEVLIEGESPEGEDAVQKLNLNTPKLCKLRGEAVAGIIFDENYEYIDDVDAKIIASQIKTRAENNQFKSFCVALEYVLTNL